MIKQPIPSLPDQGEHPLIIKAMADKFSAIIKCTENGYTCSPGVFSDQPIKLLNIEEIKEFFKEEFFNFLDGGNIIWFFDAWTKEWSWIALDSLNICDRFLNVGKRSFRLQATFTYRSLKFHPQIAITEKLYLSRNDPIGRTETIDQACEYFKNLKIAELKDFASKSPTILLVYAASLTNLDPSDRIEPFLKLKKVKSSINFDLIPTEIFNYYFQIASSSINFSEYLEILRDTGMIEHFIPDLFANSECQQDPKYHTQDVLTHLIATTKMSSNYSLFPKDEERVQRDDFYKNVHLPSGDFFRLKTNGTGQILALASLFHDVGKAATKKEND